MCVRSDHRGCSRSVDSVSKVVRVLKWSKVVNGQKVVKSGQKWSMVRKLQWSLRSKFNVVLLFKEGLTDSSEK